MLILVGLLLAVAVAILFNACFPLSRYYENLMAIPLLVMAQIVLLSQVLSIAHLLSTEGYLVGQGLLLCISGGLWWWRGRPSVGDVWRFNIRKTLQSITSYLYLSILVVLALVAVGIQSVEGAQEQRYFVDSDIYHLPRAVFWLQNQTADHFMTQNFRMTEFPPNASFVYAWMMALDGLDTGLNLPQAVAALTAALATLGLARAAGFRLDASIFAGALLLFNIELLLQLKEAQVDVIAGSLTAICFYFVVAAIQAQRDTVPLTDNIALMYLAIAFGLAVGTKFTVAFILPGAALAFVVYAIGILKTKALPILSACFVAAVSGFIVFGSYNYVLNTLSFGNPITSKEVRANSSDLVNREEFEDVGQLLDPAANLVRYLYQVNSFEVYALFLPVDLADVIQAKEQFFETVFGASGLGITYRINDRPLSTSIPSGTYPLLFAVPLTLSPLLCLFFLVNSTRSTTHRLAALYLFCVMSWVLVLVFITAWSGVKMRLFQILPPLIAAAAFPWLYSRKRIAQLWLIPLLLLAGSNFVFAYITGRADPPEKITAYVQEVRSLVPSGSTVGFVGNQLATFLLQRDISDARFVYIEEDRIKDALESGEVDVVLTDASHCDVRVDGKERVQVLQMLFLYPECVYTDPDSVAVVENIEWQTEGDTARLRIEPGLYLSQSKMTIYLRVPDEYVQAQESDMQITLHFDDALSDTADIQIVCQEEEVPAQAIEITEYRIQFGISQQRLMPDTSTSNGVICQIMEGSYAPLDYALIAPATP